MPTASDAPAPVRVIVADDHELMRRELVRLVVEALPGAVVTEAADGRQALRAFRHGGADVLVSDFRMPRMGGATLTRRLRQGGAALPIIIVSLDASAGEEAREAGASWFVDKGALATELPALLWIAAGAEGRGGHPGSLPDR